MPQNPEGLLAPEDVNSYADLVEERQITAHEWVSEDWPHEIGGQVFSNQNLAAKLHYEVWEGRSSMEQVLRMYGNQMASLPQFLYFCKCLANPAIPEGRTSLKYQIVWYNKDGYGPLYWTAFAIFYSNGHHMLSVCPTNIDMPVWPNTRILLV